MRGLARALVVLAVCVVAPGAARAERPNAGLMSGELHSARTLDRNSLQFGLVFPAVSWLSPAGSTGSEARPTWIELSGRYGVTSFLSVGTRFAFVSEKIFGFGQAGEVDARWRVWHGQRQDIATGISVARQGNSTLSGWTARVPLVVTSTLAGHWAVDATSALVWVDLEGNTIGPLNESSYGVAFGVGLGYQGRVAGVRASLERIWFSEDEHVSALLVHWTIHSRGMDER